MSKFLKNVLYVFVLAALVSGVTSCKKDDDGTPATTTGIVTGTVTDGDGNPIEGVKVASTGSGEAEQSATTGGDGKYTISGVSLKPHAITFSKTGWLTTSKSISASSFTGEPKTAVVDASLVNASAKITGTVTDAKNDNAPLAGVKVSVDGGSATTGSDGKYTIENLVENAYSVKFELANYNTVTKSIAAGDFVEGIATVNATLGANEVLRGLTVEQLQAAPKWYYNEYRGGRNADAYPHWDWACNYMATLEFVGQWQEQNEGTTVQIRNDDANKANPVNTTVFDSYVYGAKKITEDNKILSLRVRTHDASDDAKAVWGVQVVDMSAAEPVAVKIGENIETNSGDYLDYEFDLSNYVGKDVVIAAGIYRAVADPDYYKQLVFRAIRFADQKVENWDWLPGTEVVSGWKLTQQTVASTMVHDKGEFTGISPISGNRDNYFDGYRSWREVSHVGAEWSFVPLKKDPEVFAGEGYLIKTNDNADVSTTVPQAYLYAKFAIGSGSNNLTFTTRNFGSNYTYFKISAIENDGTVHHLTPTNNTAVEASAAADGVWKFKNDKGSNDFPTDYATFVYDLSELNGKDVTIVIGVYNVDANTGENKLVFRSITLN